MKAFRITQWETSHETHESRKLKFLPWVASPNKHDGLAFAYIKAEPEADKIELICAWKLMVDLAGRAVRGQRGWLMRAGKPLTATDMAMMTTFPQRIFEKAFAFFSRPEVGWMAEEEVPAETLELALDLAAPPGATAAPAKTPAASAGTTAAPAHSAADAGRISATDRQTGQDRQDRQTGDLNKKETPSESGSGAGKLAAVLGLRTQFAALEARLQELKAKDRKDWTEEDRADFKKCRAEKSEVQKKQRAGVGR